MSKGSKAQLVGEVENVSYGVQREGQGGSQLGTIQTAGGKGHLFQGAAAQIKVSRAGYKHLGVVVWELGGALDMLSCGTNVPTLQRIVVSPDTHNTNTVCR